MPSSGELAQPVDAVSADARESTPQAAAPSARRVRGPIRRRLRKAGLVFAAITPFQPLKRAIYRFGFGYRIGRAVRIGIALLDCEQLDIGDWSRISHGAAIVQCERVSIGRNVQIGSLNLIRGGRYVQIGDYCQVLRMNVINAIPENDCTNEPDSTFVMGYGSVITSEHRIDFTDRVEIGRCVTFGGRNSSIWTHNRRSGSMVRIADYAYVGSEIRMAPGSAIPPCSIVGMGAVVTKPLTSPFSLIAGVPAKRVRGLHEDDLELLYGKTRADLPDENYPPLPTSRDLDQ